MHVCRWVLAIAVAAPLAASAQTISSSFASATGTGNTGIVYIGQSRCTSTPQIDFVVDWGTNPPTSGVDTVEFWVVKDAATCSSTSDPPTGNTKLPTAPSFGVQTQTVFVDMPTLLLGLANGCNNATASASAPYSTYFCVRRKQSSFGNTTVTSASMQVSFALIPPNRPSAPTAAPGDSHLMISWSSNDVGDHSYDLYAFPSGATPDAGSPAARNITGRSYDLSTASDGGPLTNGSTYDLYVRSTDLYNNTSALSDRGTGKPIQIDDFYDRYRRYGGSATGGGGCASGGSDLLAAAGVLVVLAWRRRSRSALVAAALVAAPAAQADQHWSGIDRRPRRLLVAFKMDRYDPQIDSEFGANGPRPYHEVFRGRAPPRYQLEVDWEVAHPFGSILLGGTIGFWQNYGHGIDVATGLPSADGATLNVAPLGAIVTYRFDVLADRYQWLPIIPYLQAGLQTAFWASLNGTGHVRTSPNGGGRGSGWTYGYTTALGVAISLDSIDARLAREAYNDVGIQRTAVFAEYAWTRLDDFHKGGALILSDRAWRFGVALEF